MRDAIAKFIERHSDPHPCAGMCPESRIIPFLEAAIFIADWVTVDQEVDYFIDGAGIISGTEPLDRLRAILEGE